MLCKNGNQGPSCGCVGVENNDFIVGRHFPDNNIDITLPLTCKVTYIVNKAFVRHSFRRNV